MTLYAGPVLPLIVALIGWDLYGLGGAIYSVLLRILVLAIVDTMRYDVDANADHHAVHTDSPG